MTDILAFFKTYSSLIATVITGFTGLIAWWLARNFVKKEDFEKLENKVDSLASSKEVKVLIKDLQDTQQTIAVFSERFKHIEKDNKRLTIVIDRIDGFLREKNR